MTDYYVRVVNDGVSIVEKSGPSTRPWHTRTSCRRNSALIYADPGEDMMTTLRRRFTGAAFQVAAWSRRILPAQGTTQQRSARVQHRLLSRSMQFDFGGTDGLLTQRWRELDSNLYGAFPVKWSFLVFCRFFVRSGKGRSSSRRLRSGSRSARKGSRDRNGSKAWRLCRLASLVFRSALTPEHAERR
jgi:hypothetical protein